MNHRFRLIALLGVTAFAILLSGCLGTQYKEYRFRVKADGSGEGTVRFVNIVSQDEDDRDVSFKDFATLVTDYLDGTSFESDNPGYHVTGKRLLEENGVLVGEVSFTFTSLDSVGFLTVPNCACAPIFYLMGQSQETYVESNGRHSGESAKTPFVVWDAGTTEITVKTSLMSDVSGARDLVSHYQSWKEKK